MEKGNWPPVKEKAIVGSVRRVFSGAAGIRNLSKAAYQFIIGQMSFIAHYNLGCFQDEYDDLKKFAIILQTSEFSNDMSYNLRQADRKESDQQFREWYGASYNESIARTIRQVVAIAQGYLLI